MYLARKYSLTYSSDNKYNLTSVRSCYLVELYSNILICLATFPSMLPVRGTYIVYSSFTQAPSWGWVLSLNGWRVHECSLTLSENEWSSRLSEYWVALIESHCVRGSFQNTGMRNGLDMSNWRYINYMMIMMCIAISIVKKLTAAFPIP
jgi:hypothetical protein